MPGRAPRALKSPLEQLLISQAIERSAAKATLGLPEGTSVVLDNSGLSEDHRFVADAVEGWLGRQGLAIREEGDEAQYRLRMIVQSVGNDQDIDFFGMLATKSMWIPVALPEIALYKKVRDGALRGSTSTSSRPRTAATSVRPPPSTARCSKPATRCSSCSSGAGRT
jgi:hypothetical protein